MKFRGNDLLSLDIIFTKFHIKIHPLNIQKEPHREKLKEWDWGNGSYKYLK